MFRILATVLLSTWLATAGAAPGGIHKVEVRAPLDVTYKAVYTALEEARFWVVFEADIGRNIAGFAERWGEDYNRNGLEGMRSMVACNGWYANKVTNADPDLAALCPLRVSLVHKNGVSSILFVRPTVAAAGSPGLPVVQEVEDIVIKALAAAAVAAAGK